jgi:tyramine---L-glutamate ligase
MKILIFEYITGGGLNKQELPDTLKREGRLMLQALLDDLLALDTDTIELLVMLDLRLANTITAGHHHITTIDASQDSHEEFIKLIQQCDAVWPIAPEFDDILQTLCKSVETSGKQLLTSPSAVVSLAGNKFLTYQQLQKHAIATVPTCLLAADTTSILDMPCVMAGLATKGGEWIIKPINGVGCIDSWIITGLHELDAIHNKDHYIIQPHLHGKKTSLSCLFKNGLAWIVCVNLQHLNVIDQRYHLAKIIVNNDPDIDHYQDLVDDIAYAFPDLWGYVGIDLIETPEQTWVLEINPRLTTAFVGIEPALGINIAKLILQLLEGAPVVKPLYNKPVTVIINPDNHAH